MTSRVPRNSSPLEIRPTYRNACSETPLYSYIGSQLVCPSDSYSTLETDIFRATCATCGIVVRHHRGTLIGEIVAASWGHTEAICSRTIMGGEESRYARLRQAYRTAATFVSQGSRRGCYSPRVISFHRVKEASRGYFQDYHALRHHEGKTWIAPNSLIREDVRSW